MKISRWLLVVTLTVSFSLTTCTQKQEESKVDEPYYQPNWESLSKWEVPQWFDDAVLGIYCHWGVYSVPGYRFNDGAEQVDSGLWYGWFMYVKNDSGEPNYGVYDFHRQTYGDPKEFGYHDLVPLFKAENWDPDAWIELYKYAGADFAGVAAEHGDGYVLWDSEFDEYNSMDKGPMRDILGDLFAAAKRGGLKTVATVHERPGEMFDKAREFYDEGEGANDPQYTDLYDVPPFDVQNKKLLEIVDKYLPDQVWFEDTYVGEDNFKEFIAYYYNAGRDAGKEVLISQKYDLAPLLVSVFDVEGGIFPDGIWEWAGMEEPQEQRWQKDVPIGNYWAYAEGVGCRPVNMLVDGIVDRVSKNGVTLLDVAPKADGTLPQAQIDGLRELGDWMAINKEALHGAKPAHFVDGGIDEWRSGSIRFLEKGDFIYAIELGNVWPPEVGFAEYGGSEVPTAPYTIPGVVPAEGTEVRLIGHDESLPYRVENGDLIIESLPDQLPNDHAWSFQIRK